MFPFSTRGRIEIIGHRGDPIRAPENTLPAVQFATSAGVPSVEWDVRVTACGTPVLIHDATVDRTTSGTGRVDELTIQDLASLDAGSWFGEAFAGVRIPTLASALSLAREANVGVYCEVKALREPEDAGRILRCLQGEDMLERTVVISLDLEIVREFRRRDPTLWLGPVPDTEAALARARPWVEADRRAILDAGADLLLADPARTRSMVDGGTRLVTWTVDRESTARALVELGVTRLTTNRVREMLAWARSVFRSGE